MKKHLIIVFITIALFIVCLSGCINFNVNEKDNSLSDIEKRFVGTWFQDTDHFFTLFSDKTGSWVRESCTWDLKEGKLVIDIENDRYVPEYYFIDEDTLKLTSTVGIEYIYERQ